MRTLFTLFGREVRSYFYSPIAYVVMVIFLALCGVSFHGAVRYLTKVAQEESLLFSTYISPFFIWPYVMIMPILTMRSFSDEFRMGTIEMLSTAPVKDWQIVLAKFAGSLFFYFCLLAPSFLYFAIFKAVTGKEAVFSMGSYIGIIGILLLTGSFFISMGCLCSVMTKEQINAAAMSLVLTVAFIFLSALPLFFGDDTPNKTLNEVTSYIGFFDHLQGFARGVIDTRPMVFYSTLTFLFLFITLQVFQARKWKS
jgi:ABC-2 type transport system permease protein